MNDPVVLEAISRGNPVVRLVAVVSRVFVFDVRLSLGVLRHHHRRRAVRTHQNGTLRRRDAKNGAAQGRKRVVPMLHLEWLS